MTRRQQEWMKFPYLQHGHDNYIFMESSIGTLVLCWVEYSEIQEAPLEYQPIDKSDLELCFEKERDEAEEKRRVAVEARKNESIDDLDLPTCQSCRSSNAQQLNTNGGDVVIKCGSCGASTDDKKTIGEARNDWSSWRRISYRG